MKQFKVFTNFEKEEQYLNSMAKQGHLLKKYSFLGFYHFTDGEPQDLKYRIDYRYFKKQKDFEDYKALFEDACWKHVYGTIHSCNQYFLPKDNNADNSIFSTEESSASRYKHLYKVCYLTATVALIYFITILASYNFNLLDMAFLTPGLWEKTGVEFWYAFFFELPFVILRIAPLVLLLTIGTAYAIWASKAKKIYKHKLQEQKRANLN